jgi:hypothetical protein
VKSLALAQSHIQTVLALYCVEAEVSHGWRRDCLLVRSPHWLRSHLHLLLPLWRLHEALHERKNGAADEHEDQESWHRQSRGSAVRTRSARRYMQVAVRSRGPQSRHAPSASLPTGSPGFFSTTGLPLPMFLWNFSDRAPACRPLPLRQGYSQARQSQFRTCEARRRHGLSTPAAKCPGRNNATGPATRERLQIQPHLRCNSQSLAEARSASVASSRG